MNYYRKHKEYINPLIVFILLFLFFLLTPIIGDDYTWSAYANTLSREGGWLSSFSYLHENLNGRILGNALELFLITSPIIAALFKSFIMMSIFYLLIKIIRPSTRTELGIMALLILLPSVGMFRQAISWSAGFYNYVVPIAILLALYYLIMHVKDRGWYYYTAIGLGSIAVCLFAENISLITLFAVGGLGIYGSMRNKRFNRALTTSFVGLIVGCAAMFSSPVYTKVSSGEDHYRQIASVNSGLVSNITANLSDMSQYLIFDMMHIYIITTILLGGLILRRRRLTKRITFALTGAIGALVVLWIFQGVELGVDSLKYHLPFTILIYSMYSALLLALIVLAIEAVKNRKEYPVVVGCYALAVLYVSPFLLITPFGYRNFYLSYILFTVALLMLLRKVSRRTLDNLALPVIISVSIVTICFLAILSSSKYIEITNVNLAREQIAQGKTTIYLRKYPFYQFVHDPRSTYKIERYVGEYTCQYTKCTPDRELEILYR